MKFNPTDPEESLYEDALFWSGATSTRFPVDPDFTRSANFALDVCNALILRSNDRHDYDDRDNTGELLGFDSLVSGTQKYAIIAAWLKIARLRAKDASGNWITLEKRDRSQLTDAQIASIGTPWGYDVMGNYIYLFGTPNYASTNGLEIQFQRGSDHFVVGDTTKEPGFAPQFHRLISLLSALDYTESKDMAKRSATIRNRVGVAPDHNQAGSGMLKELSEFYSDRDRDGAPSLSLRKEDYGASGLGGSLISDNPRGF